jgi:hypothetical protein
VPGKIRLLRQRHLFGERLEDLPECSAVSNLRDVVTRKVNIDAPAAQLPAEIADSEQIVGAAQDMDRVAAVGERLHDIELIFEAASRGKGEEMLRFVNQNRVGTPVTQSLFDGVMVIGGNTAIVGLGSHHLRCPIGGMHAPLAVNEWVVHLQ